MFRVPVLRRMVLVLFALGFIGAWATAPTSWAAAPSKASELPLDRGLTQRLADFALKDVTTGRTVSLYSHHGKKAVVLIFMGIDCPVGNLYVPRLNELYDQFLGKEIVFLGINSNEHETSPEIAKYVRERGIEFPVLKDLQNKVADTALIERTCEVVVLDDDAKIRYRGAIDDQYVQGKAKDAPDHFYLRDALTAIIADKNVAKPATKVAGCLIDRVDVKPVAKSGAGRIRGAIPEVARLLAARESAHPIETGKVTYAGDVAPIMQNNCQNCHRPGQVAPFSLLTYDDAKKHTEMIREVVEERRMPPWHADPRYGHFANDRSLSPKDRATLLAWVDQGAPLGDVKALPSARTFLEGWSIGKPDVVLEVEETYQVPAQGIVSYVHRRVKTNFKEDRWIQAAEVVPGDRAVVHHIIVYVEQPGGSRRRHSSSRPMHFAAYAPGDMPSVFPRGTAKRLPAGAELIFQIHYTPIGKAATDRSKIGLVFAKTKPTREAFTEGIANVSFIIPPHQGNVGAGSAWTLQEPVRLLSLLPHMHLRGKDFKYTITKPGETPQVALSVPAYDFAWQSYYTLAEPMNLPAGTKIDCLAHYDNSDKNPYNPDPSKLVHFGEQTFEEMLIGFVDMDVPIGSPIPRAPELGSEVEDSINGLRDAWKNLTRRGPAKKQ